MKSNAPLITVVIPAYNAEKFIKETIDSVLAQKTTFLYEILISDDCSTDNTYAICESYSKQYNNITVIQQRQNIGMTKNQDFVITNAKTKYIAYLDSDDIFAVDYYLQSQVDFLEKYPETVVAFTNVEIFNEKETIKYRFDDFNKPPLSFNLDYFFKFLVPITNSAMVFRSDVCNNIPGFYVNYFQYDWLLHIHHGLQGNFGYNDIIGTRYRIHSDNATNIKHAEKKFKNAIELVYKMNSFLPYEYHKYFKHPLYEINSLAFFYLRYGKYLKFVNYYLRWLYLIPYKQFNFRDQFWLFRQSLLKKQ